MSTRYDEEGNAILISKYGRIGYPEVNQKLAVDVVSGNMNMALSFTEEDGTSNIFYAHEDTITIVETHTNCMGRKKTKKTTLKAPDRDTAIYAVIECILQNALGAKVDYPKSAYFIMTETTEKDITEEDIYV